MKLISIAAALLMCQAAVQKPAAPPVPKATDVTVSATYKGKGAVDSGHHLIVFAFTDANITSASRPVGTQHVDKNGGTVTFPGMTGPVYLFAVYDEKGNYDGVSGPPPAGVPATTYRKLPKGPPTAVAPGGPAVKFTFDDTERWNK